MRRAGTLTRADVIAAQGAYGEPIASSAWGWGYSGARAGARGFERDAGYFARRLDELVSRCEADAAEYVRESYARGWADGLASLTDNA